MIGRKEEIKKVELLLKSPKSEFLAVTGRRRVGKTYLIDTLLREHYCFSMTGIQDGNTQSQLINFAVKLSEYTETSAINNLASWQMAFLRLKQYLKTLDVTKKQVIFIDELPWVSTARSGFIQMLAHFWNDYLSKEKHFLLVICGSATSWITKKIINDSGGLHNRVTEIIHLQPFTILETQSFLQTKGIRFSTQSLARIYMALGGIPFYLENLRKGESFDTAIERMCFAPNGLLKNEYTNLYKALFNNANMHQAIVATLAEHRLGLTHGQILKRLKITNSGSYQRAIEELLVSDFIVESRPFGKTKRGVLYRLIDEYSIFYHKFIEKNQRYTAGMWAQLASSQSYKIWAGYAFENLCLKHIDLIKETLGIAKVYTEIASIQVKGDMTTDGFQIDLLIDRKDDTINLCEIKFYNAGFTIDKAYYQQLLNKKARFIAHTKTKKQVFLTMITNHELKDNQYAREIVDAQLTLEEMLGK